MYAADDVPNIKSAGKLLRLKGIEGLLGSAQEAKAKARRQNK
jgi:hypothetical protein